MKITKTIAIVLAVVMLLGVMPFSAYATDWGEGDTLDNALSELKVGFGSTYLDWLVLPNLGIVNFRYSYFQYKNERTGTVDEHPVYCIDPTKGGAYEIVKNVGKNTDGNDTATHIRGEKVGDAKYKAIIAAGFPQMRFTSLGLQSEEEGYYATKLALWMYIRGNDPTKLNINPKYGSSDPVALRVRNAAVAIYTTGTKASYTREPKLTLTAKPSATANLDASGEYYVQGVEVYASGYIGKNPDACGDVQLSWDSPPPAGTIVLGSNGEDISSTLAVKMSNNNGWIGKVTIKYPASGIDPESFGPPTFKAKAIVPNDAIYVAYAEAGRTKYQRYLVASDPKIELAASFISQVNPTIEPEKDFPSDSGLRISKLQKGTNIPLEGAVFEIRDPDGKLIYSMATDASGIIDLPLSVTGNYTVTEVTPPEYHLLSDVRTQSITVKYGEVAEVTFTNAPYGTLRVVKVDAANGMPLGGTAVQIRHITTNTTQTAHTDSSGSAVFEKLPVGAYEIVEITSPDGYALDATPHTVNVVPLSEGETSYTLTNKALPGLRITKFDRITDTNGKIRIEGLEPGIYSDKELRPPPGYLPNDTEFHVELFPGRTSQLAVNNVRKPDLLIVKTDANTGLPIEGVTYTVRKVDSATLETVRTDASGEAWMYLLDEGVYEITEQSVPPTHLLDTNKQLITLVGGRTGVARFQNFPRPKLKILKVDVITGERLPNAEFRVSKVGGSTVSEYITDASGEILIENLDVAIYKAEEFMPPDGYIRYDESKQIQLEPGKTSVLKFDNIRKPTFIVTKSNGLTYEPIPNTTYKIEYEQTDGGVYPLGTFKTDANGQIAIKNAMPGWYIITETIPAPGFNSASGPVTRKYLAPGENAFTGENGNGTGGDVSGNNILVTSGADYLRSEEIINYPLNSIVIRKVDANTGELLAGAAFEVRQVNENVSGSSITLIGRYTTDNSEYGLNQTAQAL